MAVRNQDVKDELLREGKKCMLLIVGKEPSVWFGLEPRFDGKLSGDWTSGTGALCEPSLTPPWQSCRVYAERWVAVALMDAIYMHGAFSYLLH